MFSNHRSNHVEKTSTLEGCGNVFFLTLQSFAQTMPYQPDSLNSKLLNREYESLLAYIQRQDSQQKAADSELQKKFHSAVHDIITETIPLLEGIQTLSAAEQRQMVSQSQARIDTYLQFNKDVHIVTAVDEMKKNSAAQRYGEALRWYHLGRFWHRVHLAQTGFHCLARVEQARLYLHDDRPLTADSLLSEVKPHLQANPYLQNERVAILQLLSQVKEQTNQALINQMLYDRIHEPTIRMEFSASVQWNMHAGYDAKNETQINRYHTPGQIEEYQDPLAAMSMSGQNDFGWSIHAAKYWTRGIRMDISFEAGQFRVSAADLAQIPLSNISADGRVRFKIIQLRADYLLRKKTGFRPYLGLSVGYIMTERKDQNIVEQEKWSNRETILAGKKKNSPSLGAELGADFMFSAKSRFVYRFYTRGLVAPNTAELIGGSFFSFGQQCLYAIHGN
jgi:hypothetical protein